MSQKTKDLLQTIGLVLIGAVVLYAILSGQISLGSLFGGGDEPQGGNDPAIVDPGTVDPGTADPGTNGGQSGNGGATDPGAKPSGGPTDQYGNILDPNDESATIAGVTVYKSGWYYSKDEVALYVHTWEKLPSNFLTKKAAKALGWNSGSVEKFKEGAAIGGSQFTNAEGLLPKAKGRIYTECDIDTLGEKTRGALRIVFSNDGLIYYTGDHYESFTLLYDSTGIQYDPNDDEE